MRLYDTAARQIVAFEPAGPEVGIYVCGITPYDAAHLGHAFTFHVFDILARRLRSLGLGVRMVRNVTDVDDDILRVARERGVDHRTLGDAQVARFDEDMEALRLLPVNAPRASAHVPEMVAMVERLEASGHAYAVDGWVFFDVSTAPGFGRLSRLEPEEMRELSRQRGADPDDPRKRDPLDFVLWQRSLPDEPSWSSRWGRGRPGWHIECSVLSSGQLGTPVDVHGGGDDLIYPHHEAEMAQSEAAGMRPFVRHWMHVSHVMYQGEKMSKSLGNLVFTRDLLETVPAATVRLLLADHHYRSTWSYDPGALERAERRRRAFEAVIQSRARLQPGEADRHMAAFLERIDDDLDSPGALRAADALVLAARRAAATGDSGLSAAEALAGMLDLLGAAAHRSAIGAA